MPFVIALILIVVSGLVAAAGDFMGQRAARRKLRIGKLRPRYVSRLIAVISGVVISLATFGAMFLLYSDFREALTQYNSVKQRYNVAVAERDAAERELDAMQADVQSTRAQLEDANSSISELQASMVELVKEADSKRGEVEQLSSEVRDKQAQADKAGRELAATNKQLAAARAELSSVRGDVVRGAIQLDTLRTGELLPKDSILGRVEIPAAQAAQAAALIEAELGRVKKLVAEELETVVDQSSEAKLRALKYPYADPPRDGTVLIVVSQNVAPGNPVPVDFVFQEAGRLLAAGALLLELRISDNAALIKVPGQNSATMDFPDGFDTAALQRLLLEAGDEFVSGMFALGFTPPARMDPAELGAPVLSIASLGGELLSRERPYIIQVLSKTDLKATQWPGEVTLNVFKEPGS